MINSIILGFIQAISEFIPISSSAHLKIAEYFLNFSSENNLSFVIALHFGTFISTVIVFYKEIKEAIIGFFSGLKNCKESIKTNEGFRLSVMVVIATIPTAIIGLLLERHVENITLSRVGFNLVMTGSILLMTRKYDKVDKDKKNILSTHLKYAFYIGLAQAIAVFPGISRSGITISIALFLGLNRELAGRFSFLISLPAILGAVILSLKDFSSFDISYALSGFITSFVFGLIALKLLLNFLKKGKLYYFSFYCIIVGISVFIYFNNLG